MEILFLKQFFKRLKSLLLSENLNSSVESSQKLARFLTSSGWFAKTKGRIKYKAYLPAPNGQLSVFKIGNKDDSELKKVALKYIHPNMKHLNIYGYGLNLGEDFENAKLSLIKSEPPPDHINIEGWPKSKDEQIFLAQEIAEHASLNLFKTKINKSE